MFRCDAESSKVAATPVTHQKSKWTLTDAETDTLQRRELVETSHHQHTSQSIGHEIQKCRVRLYRLFDQDAGNINGNPKDYPGYEIDQPEQSSRYAFLTCLWKITLDSMVEGNHGSGTRKHHGRHHHSPRDEIGSH